MNTNAKAQTASGEEIHSGLQEKYVTDELEMISLFLITHVLSLAGFFPKL